MLTAQSHTKWIAFSFKLPRFFISPLSVYFNSIFILLLWIWMSFIFSRILGYSMILTFHAESIQNRRLKISSILYDINRRLVPKRLSKLCTDRTHERNGIWHCQCDYTKITVFPHLSSIFCTLQVTWHLMGFGQWDLKSWKKYLL